MYLRVTTALRVKLGMEAMYPRITWTLEVKSRRWQETGVMYLRAM